MDKYIFEWDIVKAMANYLKHNVTFHDAKYAFHDPNRIIAKDIEHSQIENRYYCFGWVDDGVMTVRFTLRNSRIRIIGAGYWRKGRKIYEEAQSKIYQ